MSVKNSITETMPEISRRGFLAQATALPALVASGTAVANISDSRRYQFCGFEKFVQDLSYDELAEGFAEIGFDGVEATVRKRGHVLPERVNEDLPKLVKALRKQGLEATIIATDIVSIDQPLAQNVLRMAASLGINSYRMGYYKYDPIVSVAEQLDAFKPKVDALAGFNRRLGLSALYQNHSGDRYVGSTLWDLRQLLKGIPVEAVSCAFDIHHATVEAGLSWPVLYRLMNPHIGAIYVKDFEWNDRKIVGVPLGAGRVERKFFEMLSQGDFSGPVSLHVEYLPKEGVEKNLVALKNDFITLRKLLG